ncbi:MAG TPA: thioredoxin domain-containing protein, partial [Thermoplasmata archaeon]|nr:thioredoxin domain-containing protein [Thermoplasmata archaeon]
MGDAEPPRASRLATAGSAYLRSAAGQTIDWHPWGREAFELARRTGRPVLLDIGASWCHWCHVMDEGTYSDPEVARLLAQQFVAVKVDRDEHPEVDRRFQRQVNALTGEGGWPLTAFLTADGEAFYGGTYFPPTDGHGRPGFRRLLREIGRLWSQEPERVRANADLVRDALAREAPPGTRPSVGLDRFVAGVLRDLDAGFDPVHGGFGG